MDLRRWTFVSGLFSFLTACQGAGSFDVSRTLGGTVLGNASSSISNPVAIPVPAPTPEAVPVAKDYPLLWEAARTDAKPWTTWAYHVIETEVAADLLPGTDDIEDFCPKYASLTNHQRANFWGLLVSAMTKYESGYDPLSRMAEPSLGKDSVTGLTIESEGLLQVSYQDSRIYSFCDFDWSADKNLGVKDPAKTILNPQKNLSCGIKILARQIHNKGTIAVTSGAYWSVLIPGGPHTELAQIKTLTKKMTGCQ